LSPGIVPCEVNVVIIAKFGGCVKP
jgi:hypothetical protein